MIKWNKPWIFSKTIIIFLIIINIKKIKIKNLIIYFLSESKNLFYYNYLKIIKKIKNIILKNLIKIKKVSKKKTKKIKIIKKILKSNIMFYKLNNNKTKKIKKIYTLIIKKIFIKKNIKKFITIYLIILTDIIKSNINYFKKKKINIMYKICGKIIKNTSIINLQNIEYLIQWLLKCSFYIIIINIINKN